MDQMPLLIDWQRPQVQYLTALGVVETAGSSLVAQTIKGVHNAFELWAPFIFESRFQLAVILPNQVPSQTAYLGLQGSKIKTVDNCFYRSETAGSKELKEGAGRPTRNDYATVEGNASSYSIHRSDLTGQLKFCRSATSLSEREVLDARKLAIPSLRSLHSDQKIRRNCTDSCGFFLYFQHIQQFCVALCNLLFSWYIPSTYIGYVLIYHPHLKSPYKSMIFLIAPLPTGRKQLIKKLYY